ncbi:MAG TPA: sulfatase, partial [Candidatus Polarisedimenticolaceae bacterium]|nr:sulfatase [Candidatus Polarisedimenticolaceae bacterium]
PLAAAALAAAGYLVWRVREGPPAHLIWISLDTTRADMLGCYGNRWIRTPRLDRLADESLLFEDCMTVAPTTLASHTSMFTGKFAHHHGAGRNGLRVPDDAELLPETLRAAGFRTAGFIAGFPLDRQFGFAQGFDHYDQAYDLAAAGPGTEAERSARSVADAAVAWVEREPVPARLFLFVHFFDPHLPYRAGAPAEATLDGTCTAGRVTSWTRAMAAGYAGEVSYMDEHVGRLLDALRRRGILERALVVVTSDHGEVFGEDTFLHGLTTRDEEVRSVCLVRRPGPPAGRRIAGPLSTVDLLPSVLAFLGLAVPAGLDGRAVDLRDPVLGAHDRFAQATKPAAAERAGEWINLDKERCLRRGRWKLVQIPWQQREALYDLVADPCEQHDLHAAPPAALAAGELEAMRAALERWASTGAVVPVTPSLDREALERLKSLGYVGP